MQAENPQQNKRATSTVRKEFNKHRVSTAEKSPPAQGKNKSNKNQLENKLKIFTLMVVNMGN